MNILFLAPFGIRPKGTVIARMLPLAISLQTLGHRVTIVAPPYTNPEDSGREEAVQGVNIRNVRLGPRGKVLAAPFLAWRMFREILREKPDLVHLFKPKGYGGLAAQLLLTLKALGFHQPPLLVDTDDWEGAGGMNDIQRYSRMERVVYAHQERQLMTGAAGVTVASRELATIAAGMAIAPKCVLYLPNGVATGRAGDRNRVRQRFGIAETAPVVLLYTRFFEFDQEFLYDLFSRLHGQIPSIRFLVVGKGPNGEHDRLKQAARSMGYADALVMAGWIDPPELPDYLVAGDVAVYPFADTLVNRCKCPAKLTELLVAGTAVVAHDVGQIREYIEPGRSGELCQPNDVMAMVERTSHLLNTPAYRFEMAAAARSSMLERYAWDGLAARLEQYYREHLSR